jgi:hypothetical protein
MDRREFEETLALVVDSQGWRPLGIQLKDLWWNTANRIDEQQFYRLAMTFADTPGQRPADFMREMKAILRRQFAESRQPPKVAPDTVSDEAIKFKRLKTFLGSRRDCPYGGCQVSPDPGSGYCHCWAEVWSLPVTDEERETGAFENPLAEIFAADGGYSVMPDPKENDVVWLDA